MPLDWTEEENRLIITDYFDMLLQEARGFGYVKAEHRRALKPKLHGRSDASIEFKHQNISAVLRQLGLPHVEGYKPAQNYQASLRQMIERYLREHRAVVPALFEAAATAAPQLSGGVPLEEVEPPHPEDLESERARQEEPAARLQFDYLVREAANRQLGQMGEEAVLAHERRRLVAADRPDLAERVRWVSREIGDGAGYDVQSFAPDGRERFIEVKTTKHGIRFPFYMTANEVRFAEEHAGAYCLYRVFSYRVSPRLYVRCGAVLESFRLQPTVYRVWPR